MNNISVSYYNFQDLGSRQVPVRRRSSKGLVDSSRQVYVPFFSASTTVPKEIVNLINSSRRVYLPPSLGTHDEANSYSNGDAKQELEAMYEGGNAMIDLGIEPLKRVVYELKRLGQDSKTTEYDPRAARQAGLPTYCSYLRGKTKDLSQANLERRTAENLRARTERIVTGTGPIRRRKPSQR